MNKLRALATALILLAAAAAMADDNGVTNRGFSPDGMFHFDDVDSVNLFSGNLIAAIPIQPSFALSGGGSYSVHLVYTGIPWDFTYKFTDAATNLPVYSFDPNRRSNAGLGWRVSLGRLITPSDPTWENCSGGCAPNAFNYESPDGATHVFYPTLHPNDTAVSNVYYSRDNTYLRQTYHPAANGQPDYVELEFPDGMIHRFNASDGMLIHIRSRFDTASLPSLSVSYLYPTAGNAASVCGDADATYCWALAETAFSRTSYVTFKDDSNVRGGHVLNRIVLAGPGAVVRYAAAYTETSLAPNPSGCGDYLVAAESAVVAYPILTALTLPDGSQYRMTHFTDASAETCHSGDLQSLTLPTLGSIRYTYQNYLAPIYVGGPKNPSDPPYTPGIATRTKFAADGTTSLGQWTYAPAGGDAYGNHSCTPQQLYWGTPRELDVTLTDPLGNKTTSYFSAYHHVVTCDTANAEGWKLSEFGLPFTRHTSRSDGNTARYLSTQVTPAGAASPTRETYVAYEVDGNNAIRKGDDDRRVVTSETIYVDDLSRYATVDNSDFDGLGHYRTSTTGGNFGLGNVVSHTTHFNPAQGTYVPPGTSYSMLSSTAPWVLGTFDYSQTAEGNSVEKTEACFDGNTGFLNRSRRLANGAAEGTNDLIAVFDNHDSSNNVTPFVTSETYYGGDAVSCDTATEAACAAQSVLYPTRSVPTGSLCSLTLTSPQYQLKHTYSYGLRATSQYFNGTVAAGFKSLDRTFDPSGFILSERDTAGVTTNYGYYTTGDTTRIQTVSTPLTSVTYSYVNASNNGSTFTPALATAVQAGITTKYEFDPLGRFFRTTRDMPNRTTAVSTVDYDVLGRKSAASEWEASNPSHKTLFGYDVFGRPTSIQAPDDSTTTISYAGVSQTTRTSKVFTGTSLEDAATTENYDRQGRLIKVTEPNTIATTYSYDVGGRLSGVCSNDTGTSPGMTCGQRRTFTYDNRGLLTSEIHPEEGTISYKYDARGHVLNKSRSDTTSLDLMFFYDAAERLIQTDARNLADGTFRIFKSYTFDVNSSSDLGNGKLSASTRHNYLPVGDYQVTESLTYGDADGRLTAKSTAITDPFGNTKTVSQTQAYDALSRPTSIDYPSCSGCGTSNWASLTNIYDKGSLASVGLPAAPTAFGSLQYGPSGMVTGITHGNGMVDTYATDTTMMPRPQSISFGSFAGCTGPSIAIQPQSASVPSNGAATLTVQAAAGSSAPLSYQWYDAATGQPVPSGGTSSSFTTPPITQAKTYYVRLSNSCGRVPSVTVTVSTCQSPSVTGPQNVTIGMNQTALLSITATGASSYQWYVGTAPDTSNPIANAISSSYQTPVLSATTSYWVRVTGCGGTANSATAVVKVLATPASLVATMGNTTQQIVVTWGTVTGATGYVVQRRYNGGAFTTIATPTAPPFNDSVAASTTYVYQVAAYDGNGQGLFSNADLATTMTFTPITAGVTRIAATDFNDILIAINAMRAASGLPQRTWSMILQGNPAPPAPASGGRIFGEHVLALRREMNSALNSLGFASGNYTDSALTNIVIKAIHITQLRAVTQ